MSGLLYPLQDGAGAGPMVEITVRVLVGTERSTVIVAMGRDKRFLLHEVREYGHAVDGIGAAVEAALRDALLA